MFRITLFDNGAALGKTLQMGFSKCVIGFFKKKRFIYYSLFITKGRGSPTDITKLRKLNER